MVSTISHPPAIPWHASLGQLRPRELRVGGNLVFLHLRVSSFLCRVTDIYCYACDDMKTDPELGAHLSTFGVNIAQQQKTVKSMAELVCAWVLTILFLWTSHAHDACRHHSIRI